VIIFEIITAKVIKTTP